MTEYDHSQVPRAVATVTEVAALKELLEAEMRAIESRAVLRDDAARDAVQKAEEAQKERNKQQNEWRATVTELVHRTTTPEQLDQVRHSIIVQLEAHAIRVDKLEDWKNVEQGSKQVRQVLLPVMVGVAVFLLTQIARVVFPVGHDDDKPQSPIIYNVPLTPAAPPIAPPGSTQVAPR